MRLKRINFSALTAVFAILAVVIVTYTNDIVTNAAAVVPESYQCVFDASYYAGRYPDLQAAFGTNEAALFNHFITCGMAEGRQGCAEFDVNYYRAAYPDLQAAFGDNLPAYYNHYMTCGKSEGRTGAGTAPAPAGSNTSVAPNTHASNNNGPRVYMYPNNFRESQKNFYANILDSILTPNMTDMEVAKAIHDYLCRTYHYGQEGETITYLDWIYGYSIGIFEDGHPECAYPAFVTSTAFYCDGYSEAFRMLMNIAGIPTQTMDGRSGYDGVGHAWNCTYINGQFLFTDVTWDDGRNGIKYDYFMISEDQMMQNHLPDRRGTRYAYILNTFKESVSQNTFYNFYTP